MDENNRNRYRVTIFNRISLIRMEHQTAKFMTYKTRTGHIRRVTKEGVFETFDEARDYLVQKGREKVRKAQALVAYEEKQLDRAISMTTVDVDEE